MSLIHLHNEIVSHRDLASESWSTYLCFSVEESSGAIIAETFSVYHNAQRPDLSWKECIGQQRISHNKAPFSVGEELRMLDDIIPHQPRDTTTFDRGGSTARTPEPTVRVLAELPA
jgi:hypothetical protein